MFELPPPAIDLPAPEIGGYVFRDECVLGTRMQLQLVACSYAAALDAALAIRAEIDRLELILSGWRADSELAQLNRASMFRASPELFAVIVLAEQWRERTHGAFSARLGRVIDVWRKASRTPDPAEIARLARQANDARVQLDPNARTIVRPEAVKFAVDGIAKGWIVDRAFERALCLPGVSGALIEIGGDLRAGGATPSPQGWQIDIADPNLPFDNAPRIATAHLKEHAIATSGRGPRDLALDGTRFATTLSPFDGWPIEHHLSASVIASTAADADALATAMLVLPANFAIETAERFGASARITEPDLSARFTALAQSETAPAHFVAAQDSTARSTSHESDRWQSGWQALATFTAPRRQLIRDPSFRSPYMAMWITDPDNKPVRTLILIGKRADWQKDNFIWWSMNREKTERLVSTRSMSTSAAGVYNVFWDGVDDAGETVRAGTYVLHVETSRERGKHTYRSLTLDFGKFQRFAEVLPPTEEGGGLRVSFDHY